ncbi:MAG: hypothetical protein JEY94_11560 [Melioribacteraceae bacterium]|nr:hypothetical protein [Melioribacteraceae bacterium]
MKVLIIFILITFLFQEEYTPFKKLYEKDGLLINYVFYSEGNGVKDNGITLFLHNKNNFGIEYSFDLIFRAGKTDKYQKVDGKLKAGEKKTGSSEKLFWIPFDDKRTITELGITNFSIKKMEPAKNITVEETKL